MRALIAAATGLLLLGLATWPRLWHRVQIEFAEREQEGIAERTTSKRINESTVNLAIPFTSQAPLGIWDSLHKEACEEAAAIMAMRFLQGRGFDNPEDAEAAILDLVGTSEQDLGLPVDQTAEQIASLIEHAAPELKATLSPHSTVETLKEELRQGHPVIVPAAGRQLRNPFYRRPGPLYHTLVLRGFTQDGYVIVNDPGTKRGEGYAYRWETVMDALHDWPFQRSEHLSLSEGEKEARMEQGRKVAIVLQRR